MIKIFYILKMKIEENLSNIFLKESISYLNDYEEEKINVDDKEDDNEKKISNLKKKLKRKKLIV
jgi:hypothetical protein